MNEDALMNLLSVAVPPLVVVVYTAIVVAVTVFIVKKNRGRDKK